MLVYMLDLWLVDLIISINGIRALLGIDLAFEADQNEKVGGDSIYESNQNPNPRRNG